MGFNCMKGFVNRFMLLFICMLFAPIHAVEEQHCISDLKTALRILLDSSKVSHSEGDIIDIKLRFKKPDVDILNEFMEGSDSLLLTSDVLSILQSSIIIDDGIGGHIPASGLPAHVVIVMCVGTVCLCLMWMLLTRNHLTPCLMMLTVFSLALAWNWWKLYQEEFIRRVHLLPVECKPEEASWYHSVKGYIVDPDCQSYLDAPIDDPLSLVSPKKIFSETISMLLVTPFTLIFISLTQVIFNLTDKLGWPMNTIAVILLSVVVVVGLVFSVLSGIAALFNLNIKFSMFSLCAEVKACKATRRPQLGQRWSRAVLPVSPR